MSRRSSIFLLACTVFVAPAKPVDAQERQPVRRRMPAPPGAAAPAQTQPGAVAPESDELEPPLGPTDPGPYPQMPGYYTRRARELNYPRSPYYGASPYYGYGYGAGVYSDYFPGVYPYYDAQYHYQWYQANKRERSIKNKADDLRGQGLDAMRVGDYETAAIRLLGAAELDQGDPSARIHAGHALFAVGRYEDAAFLLRRGFELQPSLVYDRFDPREDFGRQADFDAQLDALRQYVDAHRDSAGARTVLAYLVYFTEGPTKARPLLEKASECAPNDSLVERLSNVASRASMTDHAARVGARDLRPYDSMGVRPKVMPTYDESRRLKYEKLDTRRSDPEYRKQIRRI